MSLLPKKSFCTLLDTKEVMLVDSHEITENDSGVEELVVKGRSLDVFLKNRFWANAPYGKACAMAKNYTLREAVEVWVWNAICNGTGNDRIKTGSLYSAANQLPNTIVTDSVPQSFGTSKVRKVQNGEVYEQMMTMLSAGKLGIRIIRPSNTKGRKVSVAGDGTHSTDHINGITDLRFDIYKGRDLSDSIVFSFKTDDLTDVSIFRSSENFKSGVFVDGDPRSHYYTDPDAVPGTNSGWNRYDLYVDGGAKEDSMSADDFESSLEDQGLRSLRQGRDVSAVDAKISPDITFEYNRDYRLGDIVKVQSKHGVIDKKYITEFVRTKDENGVVGYPTLSNTLS
jgi:hypothetical protein